MAVTKPQDAAQVSRQAKVDTKRELRDSNPFLARGWFLGIIVGLANRVFEFYIALTDAERESNPATAVDNRLRWAQVWNLRQLPGSPAVGLVWVNASSGGLGTLIEAGRRFLASDGAIYVSQGDGTPVAVPFTPASITAASGVATVVTSGDHDLASNAVVSITGANEPGFNVADALITVLSATSFSYQMTDLVLSGPATGSPSIEKFGVNLTLNSEQVGEARALDADAPLTFESQITGIETPVLVTFGGLKDGLDVETEEDLQTRLLRLIGNPITPFNVANIEATALAVLGVTRVFTDPATPASGQSTTLFMRDNDTDPIPTVGDVTNVKNALLVIKQAGTSDVDVIVAAPVAVETNFVFSAISPDTATMRAAIETQLEEYFKKVPVPSTDVVQEAYQATIFNTIDQITGDTMISFTLTGPVADITVASGEIATLGTVTFP